MRRRVRGSRGAKRRWGPHISSPWPKGRENKGDEVTVPTACGIETHQSWCLCRQNKLCVATVPTACGIETCQWSSQRSMVPFSLQQYLPLAVLKQGVQYQLLTICQVATVLTACGMRRRVRGSREAKRRWGPHISSPWLKGRENKGDDVTALTACGIETRHLASRIHTLKT